MKRWIDHFVRRYALAVVGSCLSLMGCQVTPTKTGEVRARPPFELVSAKAETPLVLNDLTVVLDVRSGFDFGLNHVVNSYNFPWVNLAETEASGLTLRDTHKSFLRLALAGITPDTPVVVVGYGLAGAGEEGRLAWNLLELGVKDVQVAAVETFRKQMTQQASGPAQNVKMWRGETRDELQIGKDEFLALAGDVKSRFRDHVHILDVRSEKEFLRSNRPDIGAVNIEWKTFYTREGRPNLRFKEKLVAMGIRPEDRIVVMSQHGVRSGAVTYALLAMGFERVANFTGGWNSIQ